MIFACNLGVNLLEVQRLSEGALEKAMARDPRIKLEVKVADIKNAFTVAPDAPIVVSLSEAWEEVMGEKPKATGGSWLCGILPNYAGQAKR